MNILAVDYVGVVLSRNWFVSYIFPYRILCWYCGKK